MTIEERFWSKVDKTDTCWLWTASTNTDGYGHINIQGKTKASHRLVWTWINGSIPNKLQVLHKCDNTRCVKPEHLFLGTQQENIKDMINKNRQSKKMGRKGEKHSQNKLTELNVKRIRQLYEETTLTQKELAEMFKVCQAQIWRIINKKNWSHF